ncbi:MAG: class I SAM-dependent methyltransferase [Pseudomonadota bacterium]
MTAFFTLHQDLPREGPGDRESLDWALTLAAPPRDGQILDAGCGPGADLLDLVAHVPDGRVIGLEQHAPFVEAAAARVAEERRVDVRHGDMAAAEGPFDVIWCAGALYFLGVEAGLRGWRASLTPGGAVVFSDAVWLGTARPEAARRQWEEYPAMTDIPGTLARIRASGYRSMGHRILSDAAWEAYYTPLERRIADLSPGADPALAAVLEEGRREIEVWRAHRDAFGYALFVARI